MKVHWIGVAVVLTAMFVFAIWVCVDMSCGDILLHTMPPECWICISVRLTTCVCC